MENKTALQQLKENWEQKQKELIEAFEDDKIVDVHFTAANKAISAFLKDIERLLPMEREQIEEAHIEGQVLIFGLIKDFIPQWDFSESVLEIEKARVEGDEKAKDYFTSKYGNK